MSKHQTRQTKNSAPVAESEPNVVTDGSHIITGDLLTSLERVNKAHGQTLEKLGS